MKEKKKNYCKNTDSGTWTVVSHPTIESLKNWKPEQCSSAFYQKVTLPLPLKDNNIFSILYQVPLE